MTRSTASIAAQLHRSGSHAGRQLGDSSTGTHQRVECGHDSGGGRRWWSEAQGCLGDHSERAFGAHEQSLQVVAGHVLDGPTAQTHGPPVGEHHLQAQHVVGRHPVPDTAESPGVRCEIAPDRADLERRRIGRIPEPCRDGSLFDLCVAEPRADHRQHRRGIHLDRTHRLGGQHDATVDRGRTTGEPGTQPARYHRSAVLRRHRHHFLHGGHAPRTDQRTGRTRNSCHGPVPRVRVHHVGIEHQLRARDPAGKFVADQLFVGPAVGTVDRGTGLHHVRLTMPQRGYGSSDHAP